jgi:hypothetical protein
MVILFLKNKNKERGNKIMQENSLGDKFTSCHRPTEVKEIIVYNDAIDAIIMKCMADVAEHLGVKVHEWGDFDSVAEVRDVVLTELKVRLNVDHLDAGEY